MARHMPQHTPFGQGSGRPVQAYAMALLTGHTVQQAEQAAQTAGATPGDIPLVSQAARAAMVAGEAFGSRREATPTAATPAEELQYEVATVGAMLPGASVYTATVHYEFVEGGISGAPPGAGPIWKTTQVDIPLGADIHEAALIIRAKVLEETEGPEADYPGELLGYEVATVIGH